MREYLMSLYVERDIRELRANGVSRREVAQMYGLHPVYVSKLTNGRARQYVAA